MTFQEWKAQKAARAAGSGAVIDMQAIRAQLAESDRVIALSRAARAAGGGLKLVDVGVDGRPVKDPMPAWTKHFERHPEGDSRILAAIRSGEIRNFSDYKRIKRELGIGPSGEAA